MNKKKFWIVLFILIICVIFSACLGRYTLSLKDIFSILVGNHTSEVEVNLFYNIRLSRTFLVVISGGALALSGSIFQTIFRNPLVSPDVLGVSSGCSVGAVLSIVLLGGGVIITQSMTFLFGVMVVLFSIFLSRFVKNDRILGLVLAGIVMGSIASSIIMMLKLVADPNSHLQAIEFWLMGGFNNATWSQFNIIFLPIMLITVILYLLRYKINIMSLGDEEAKSLGLNVKVVRIIVILLATLLVALVVSFAGVVSWVGLLSPHIVKMYSKDDIVNNFSLSFLTGSILLIVSDVLARTLFTIELPISIVTSFIGAIFLIILLIKNKREAL